MNHEITRIVDDRIYIKNLKYGGRPDTWVKAVDLKKSLKENKEYQIPTEVKNLEKYGVKFTIDPQNKVSPIQRIGVPVNLDDKIYDKIQDILYRHNLKSKKYFLNEEKKSNKTINTKKEALLALDYIEPTIKENENTLMDIENQLLDANIGDMAYGGGYGPFEKVTRNTWKNTKTGSLQHSRKLTEFIGGFSDFRISSSTNESKLRSAIHQFIKEELNRGKL
jgi:hypothetical protein